MYSEEVLKRLMNPKNVGEIENADAQATVGNPACGDMMTVYLKIEEKDGKKIITDAKFKTFGCAAAIATSDVACDLVKGKTIEEAEKIMMEKIVNQLGGLPKIKLHCSAMAVEAIRKALSEYEGK